MNAEVRSTFCFQRHLIIIQRSLRLKWYQYVPFRLSVRLQISERLPMDRFTSNFILETVMKICQEYSDLLQPGQNMTLYMKTEVSFIVGGDMKTPQKRSIRVKRYQTVRAAEMA